ncbi:MAG: hypothetical protein ACRCTY_07560, partial [Candidatus Adiutrix sp.]
TKVLKKGTVGVGTSLAPTLFRFYLLFAATALACVVVIKFQWGHPLAFLAGLLSLALGLGFGLISLIFWPIPSQEQKKTKGPDHGE